VKPTWQLRKTTIKNEKWLQKNDLKCLILKLILNRLTAMATYQMKGCSYIAKLVKKELLHGKKIEELRVLQRLSLQQT